MDVTISFWQAVKLGMGITLGSILLFPVAMIVIYIISIPFQLFS